MEKRAILVVSFGTTDDTAIEKTILPVERAVAEAFPGWEVRRAFTSRIVVQQLNRRGIAVDSPESALEALRREGFHHVAVLPTFLAPGGEYRRLLERMEGYRSSFAALAIARPLLAEQETIHVLAGILQDAYPPEEKEAVLFMGHGTEAEENRCYQALGSALQKHAYVALLHGEPGLEPVLADICSRGYTSVRLVPLMLSAGTHAAKHMAGDSPDSWKNRCKACGLKTDCIMTGLGELPQVQQLYLYLLRECLKEAMS